MLLITGIAISIKGNFPLIILKLQERNSKSEWPKKENHHQKQIKRKVRLELTANEFSLQLTSISLIFPRGLGF